MVRKYYRKKGNHIDYKYNLRTYWFLLRPYKFLFFALLFVVLLIETSFIVDKFLLKIIVDGSSTLTAGHKESFLSLLYGLAAIYLLVSVGRSALRWMHLHLINRLDGNLITDLKRKFFNHIVRLSYNFHTSSKTGSLISRLVRGGRAIEAMSDTVIFNTAPLFFQVIIVTGSLLYFDWTSALITLLTIGIFIIYSYYLQQRQQPSAISANDAEDREKAHISDYLTNIESIKYFGKESAIIRRFGKAAEETRLAYIRNWDYFRMLEAGQLLIIALGTFFLIYFPLQGFLNGTTTIGTLVFIYTAYGNLLPPLFSFVHGMKNFYRAMADFESLFPYAKLQNEIKDKANARPLEIITGTVEFRNLSFSYKQRKIFENFTLSIPKNKKVAFVGHSGSGKTTLIKLLYRFYDPQEGDVYIDSKNVKNFTQESVRAGLSIVPQECVLFDDTIWNNITFADVKASKKAVWQAIRFAQLDSVIEKLPKKEHTVVGERGVRLSGGEKQRVSIARALLANKKILVLDEATSSLDSKTEHDIQMALKKLMKGRTTIIIAHRLSTIMQADIIVVMDKGKIVQQGNHAELIEQPGLYQRLWNLQKGGYIR